MKQFHIDYGDNHGHGLDHDVTVAQFAALVAPTERLGEKGWVAGMLHSSDRIVGKEKFGDQTKEFLGLLPKDYFSRIEIDQIYEAVIRHGEKFTIADNETHAVLQDADKLGNLGMSVFIRGGQFRPNIPAFDFLYLEKNNPGSTYHEPQSVLDAVRITISEYRDTFNFAKSREIAHIYIKDLEMCVQKIKENAEEIGLAGANLND